MSCRLFVEKKGNGSKLHSGTGSGDAYQFKLHYDQQRASTAIESILHPGLWIGVGRDKFFPFPSKDQNLYLHDKITDHERWTLKQI